MIAARSIREDFGEVLLGSFCCKKLHRFFVGRNEQPLASTTVALHCNVDRVSFDLSAEDTNDNDKRKHGADASRP
jgi:hypothetical protein